MAVVVEPGCEGLGVMLGELVRANLERDPARRALLRCKAGRVNLRAADAGVHVGIVLGGGQFRVTEMPLPSPDLDITTDAETLMALSSVPLRFGLPDAATAEGRDVTRKLLTGKLRVRGLLTRPGLLVRLNKLLSTA